MQPVTAKDFISGLSDETQDALKKAQQRYLDATASAEASTNPEVSSADRRQYGHLLTLAQAPVYERNDKDCIEFIKAVTGLTELECAAYLLSDLPVWHRDEPFGKL